MYLRAVPVGRGRQHAQPRGLLAAITIDGRDHCSVKSVVIRVGDEYGSFIG
jgi:hypothetical protein